MPRLYTAVKRSYKRAGESDKAAKRKAAATFIGRGMTASARRRRAKMLQHR